MPILVSPTPTPLPPSHGAAVADWMEANLVHGEGDLEGEPFRLAGHMLRALFRWFEYSPPRRGRPIVYSHRKGVIGWPKGSAKTEFEQALALEQLEGPSIVVGTPVVTVASVDGDMANELVYRASMMIPPEDSPQTSDLRERLRYVAGERHKIVHQRGYGRGRILATSQALGKNDGKLTSLLLADELHEWDYHSDAGAKRHGILERATNKRRGSRQLNVSTAGWSIASLLGAMYAYGCQVASGEVVDPTFLFEWWEASDHWDLDDPAQLEAAIREANPMAAEVDWLVDQLARSYREHKLRGKVGEFLRYHLNRWVEAQDGAAWLDDIRLWDARAVTDGVLVPGPGGSMVAPPPPDDVDVVLGFDGSETGDSTALVGATVEPEPYIWVVDCWERPERDPEGGWRVPVTEVEDRIVAECTRRGRHVVEVAADVAYWRGSLERLREQHGVPVVEFPQSNDRLGPACERAYEAITRGQMTHDGDPRLRRHIANARRRETEHGVRISKKHVMSRRWIDLAIAAVMAHARAAQLAHINTEESNEPWVAFD